MNSVLDFGYFWPWFSPTWLSAACIRGGYSSHVKTSRPACLPATDYYKSTYNEEMWTTRFHHVHYTYLLIPDSLSSLSADFTRSVGVIGVTGQCMHECAFCVTMHFASLPHNQVKLFEPRIYKETEKEREKKLLLASAGF